MDVADTSGLVACVGTLSFEVAVDSLARGLEFSRVFPVVPIVEHCVSGLPDVVSIAP